MKIKKKLTVSFHKFFLRRVGLCAQPLDKLKYQISIKQGLRKKSQKSKITQSLCMFQGNLTCPYEEWFELKRSFCLSCLKSWLLVFLLAIWAMSSIFNLSCGFSLCKNRSAWQVVIVPWKTSSPVVSEGRGHASPSQTYYKPSIN